MILTGCLDSRPVFLPRKLAGQVAAELHLTVAAVYMAKQRVQKMLAEEVRRLQGSGPEPAEGEP
jgi:hypothetical protein